MAAQPARPIAATPILIAMAVGALVGWAIGPEGRIAGVDVLGFFDFLGTVFINMLKMVVVPLIATVTYLTVVTIISVQITSESAPSVKTRSGACEVRLRTDFSV